MNIESHIPASSGSLSVALIALFFAIIQLWLYWIRREEHWHLWGMLISLSTMVFAVSVYVQYFGQPDETNRLAEKLQITAIISLVHCTFGFTCAYLGLVYKRIYHLSAVFFNILLVLLVWNTHLIVSNRFVYRNFLLLDRPYIEPRLGWLGTFVFIYISIAIGIILFILVKHIRHEDTARNLSMYAAGFIFWIFLGLNDVVATFLNVKTLIFMMEYGFLGFSASVILVILKNNLEFSELAEHRARKLSREKERYQALSEVIFDYAFAFRVEPDGRFVADWVAGPIERITGYTADELADARTRKHFVFPDDRPLLKSHTAKLLDGISETIEFRIRTKTGQLRWIRDHGRSIYDPNQKRVTYIYGAMQDITDRRQVEDALRENEKKYRILFENANDGIFIVQDENMTFPNPRALEITGYSENEFIQLKIGDLVHPDDREMVTNNYASRIRGHHAPQTYTFRLITRQDKTRNVQINAVRITWENKPATLNFVRDITTEKILEERLQQRKKYEAVGILAGGMSHDINNALTGILGNLELLKIKFHRGVLDTDSFDKHLKPISSAVDRVTAQCQKLLAYARGGKYLMQTIDINDIVSETLDALKTDDLSRIQIHMECGEPRPGVRADYGQMKMIMEAVTQNAIESIPDGNGKIRVSTETVTIAPDGSENIAPGRYVRITVTDTGIGMDDETRAKIFDPFFSTKFHGRGMSLAAVFGILKNHRGAIRVDSVPGAGTAVKIYIPSVEITAEVMTGMESGTLTAAK